MSSVDENYEREFREEQERQFTSLVPRELLPNGAYAPIRGILDIGWKAWEELPAADFVKDLRRFDDGIIKENQEWIFQLAPMINKAEFTMNQLKAYLPHYFALVDGFAPLIAGNIFPNERNKEVRDIILRHAAEEIGHSELFADFCVNAVGLDRVKDVWMFSSKKFGPSYWYDAAGDLKKSNPELAYALIPFIERSLPRQHEIMTRAWRSAYDFPDRYLGFFYLHRYVDIYHERFGLWVLAKYGTNKKAQEKVVEAIRVMRKNQVTWSEEMYDLIRKVK